MFKKIRRLWNLASQDNPINLENLKNLKPGETIWNTFEPKGDGNAVFFGEGTEEEFLEQQRNDKGLKGWYDRLKNL